MYCIHVYSKIILYTCIQYNLVQGNSSKDSCTVSTYTVKILYMCIQYNLIRGASEERRGDGGKMKLLIALLVHSELIISFDCVAPTQSFQPARDLRYGNGGRRVLGIDGRQYLGDVGSCPRSLKSLARFEPLIHRVNVDCSRVGD
jgi:hypothetical protein